MKRLSFIILLIKAITLPAQNSAALDSLVAYEWSAFTVPADSGKIITRKLHFLLKNKDYVAASAESKRLNRYEMNAADLWNCCLLSLQNKELHAAGDFFEGYWKSCDTLSRANQLLGFLTYLNSDSLRAMHYLKKIEAGAPEFSCLRCYYSVITMESKPALPYMVSSAILPGSGLVMLGKPVKGVTSLLITGGFVIASVAMINTGLFINLVGWTAGWGVKFYLGQLGLTEKEFNSKFLKRKNRQAELCGKNFKEKLSLIDYKFQ